MGEFDYIFAHESPRAEQKVLADAVYEAVNNKTHVIAHAPTGLGKTAAVLSPAVAFAARHKKVIFFLTSRYTQHAIAVSTLQQLKERSGMSISVVDLIAKKNMCAVPGANLLAGGEFLTYCKKQRENNLCEHYERTRKKNNELTIDAKLAVEQQVGRILDVVSKI